MPSGFDPVDDDGGIDLPAPAQPIEVVGEQDITGLQSVEQGVKLGRCRSPPSRLLGRRRRRLGRVPVPMLGRRFLRVERRVVLLPGATDPAIDHDSLAHAGSSDQIPVLE